MKLLNGVKRKKIIYTKACLLPYCKTTICFIILFKMISPVMSVADCPHYCDCKWKNGKETIMCMNFNITKIPYRLDAGTQVLDLSKTDISKLERDEFVNRGLVNLQKLYITNSKLKWIDKYSFRKLVNLVDLDLRYSTHIPKS